MSSEEQIGTPVTDEHQEAPSKQYQENQRIISELNAKREMLEKKAKNYNQYAKILKSALLVIIGVGMMLMILIILIMLLEPSREESITHAQSARVYLKSLEHHLERRIARVWMLSTQLKDSTTIQLISLRRNDLLDLGICNLCVNLACVEMLQDAKVPLIGREECLDEMAFLRVYFKHVHGEHAWIRDTRLSVSKIRKKAVELRERIDAAKVEQEKTIICPQWCPYKKGSPFHQHDSFGNLPSSSCELCCPNEHYIYSKAGDGSKVHLKSTGCERYKKLIHEQHAPPPPSNAK